MNLDGSSRCCFVLPFLIGEMIRVNFHLLGICYRQKGFIRYMSSHSAQGARTLGTRNGIHVPLESQALVWMGLRSVVLGTLRQLQAQ